ncbi:hypothetical protein N7537_003825 [Penicillium hordei]|uniref:DUF7587 domain-containing protein n=1 Tax=Penicillium hordei TaxID=40994 RepID=A0AAD6EAE5_9EURO|nr:uncharacterized protein N7537_003825 [Penicillium hordei]KAJ5607206.1 hypothetical protein N7537_003825 [Penicillium hordei]
MIRRQRVPTALISVTICPIEALYRASERCYVLQQDPEDPAEIWIVIIFGLDDANTTLHHARELAQQLMDSKDSNAFKYEYLFEREIPTSYLQHNVSLKELIKRGLTDGMFLNIEGSFPSTLEEFRNVVMSAILSDAYGAGRWLGGARAFGAGHLFSWKFRRIDRYRQYIDVYWVNDEGDLEFDYGLEFGSI